MVVYFQLGVWRYLLSDKQDSSHAFFILSKPAFLGTFQGEKILINMVKSFKLLLNSKKLSKETYELIKELERVTQIENGEFVYDEKDEEKLRNILDKFSPLSNQTKENKQ